MVVYDVGMMVYELMMILGCCWDDLRMIVGCFFDGCMMIWG